MRGNSANENLCNILLVRQLTESSLNATYVAKLTLGQLIAELT